MLHPSTFIAFAGLSGRRVPSRHPGGDADAALSGNAVADPFVSTTGILELLGLRAAQVRPR